jgi:hypothetical protein
MSILASLENRNGKSIDAVILGMSTQKLEAFKRVRELGTSLAQIELYFGRIWAGSPQREEFLADIRALWEATEPRG